LWRRPGPKWGCGAKERRRRRKVETCTDMSLLQSSHTVKLFWELHNPTMYLCRLMKICDHATEAWICLLMQMVCGSFTNLLKLKVGARSDRTPSDSSSQASEADCAPPTEEAHEISESGVY
jgi:hypothetical protein